MFKIGDIVEITDESDSTGMLDFKKDKGYKVLDSKFSVCEDGFTWRAIKLENESGLRDWYGVGHFKLKEGIKVEKKECLFKEGQVVWDLRNGRGVVVGIINDKIYPVKVKFDLKDIDGVAIVSHYTKDGRYAETQTIRSLYFSEPKIEAATEPLFEPTLKEGDVVVVCSKGTITGVAMGTVSQETEEVLYFGPDSHGYVKDGFDFYKVGEKINFK